MADNDNNNLGAGLSGTGDAIYSAAFTYDFLTGINTIGTHRPKQIKIPKADLDKMTGMERQYWDIKSKYFDVVLFFKKGKFYELYDCDAVIGNKEFGLKMTGDSSNRGKMRMSGVPEKSFAEWSRLFVFKGYKVGKVEQMMVTDEMRAANGGKDPKVIPRELSVILSRGTLTEGNAISGPEPLYVVAISPRLISSPQNNNNNNNNNNVENLFTFDAVAVDLSRQCYFHCPCDNITELVTLLHHLTPKEVLLPNEEKTPNNNTKSANNNNNKSPQQAVLGMLAHVVADLLPDSHIERVDSATHFVNQQQQQQELPPSWHLVYNYFSYLKIDANRLLPTRFEGNNNNTSSSSQEQVYDPSASILMFVPYTQHTKSSQQDVPPPAHLSSLSESNNNNNNNNNNTQKILDIERRCDPGVSLDSAAIECLDLVVNSRDGSSNSTILSWLTADRTCLPSSHRMIRDWLLRPSSNEQVISARQETVQLLFDPSIQQQHQSIRNFVSAWTQLVEKKTSSLSASSSNNKSAVACSDDDDDDENGEANNNKGTAKSFGFYDIALSQTDFERLLSRISDFKSEDTRVSLTEPLVHYRKNLFNIHQAIQGFEQLISFYTHADKSLKEFCSATNSGQNTTKLLRELVDTIGLVRIPINEVLKKFPRQRIERDGGYLLPLPGQHADYDKAQQEITSAEKVIQDKRAWFVSKLGENSSNVKYVNIGKDLFLLEIPTKCASAANLEKCGIPRGELTERARTNKTVKCSVASLQKIIEEHKKATTARELAINATLREVAASLCQSWHLLFSASRAASYLDCLFGLANVARQQSCRSDICFPTFVASPTSTSTTSQQQQQQQQQTSLEFKQAYHPLLLLLGRNCVPNDICLGGFDPDSNDDTIQRTFILTGPNMAGKSTLMRTVAVNVILAQIGCPVCAKSMRIIGSPIDRVFTRIGAKDATHRGQSTLFVELSETATILKEATGRSLCLLDELGRGTSTHDGYAIAHACLRAVAGIDVIDEHEEGKSKKQAGDGGDKDKLQSHLHNLPLVLFATHYHALALEIHQKTGLAATRCQQGYMMFGSERRQRTSSSTTSTPQEEHQQQQLEQAQNMTQNSTVSSISSSSSSSVRTDVQFLYKLAPGICARSYGAEVALQAGLPRSVVERARLISRKMALTSADYQLADFRRFMRIVVEEMMTTTSQHATADDEEALLNRVRARAAQLVALANSAHSAAY